MDQSRAKHLVARREELQERIGELLDEYADALSPDAMEAMDWYRARHSITGTEDSRAEADLRLHEWRPFAFDGFMVRSWALGAEMAPLEIGHMGTVFTYLSKRDQPTSSTFGIYHNALF